MYRRRALTAVGVGLAFAACAEPPLEPEAPLDTGRLPAVVATEELASFSGDIGPGSSYEILVPAAWNGDLVLYAHGYVDPEGEDALTPLEQTLLPLLPEMGYAVAYSTYSDNGLVVKDAMQRTKQLRGIFVAEVGRPEHTYVAGASMGGLVAVGLVERFPWHYDGALAVCGMVGGTQAQIDYIGHVRVLFDALYPGALPGGLFESPPLTKEQVAAAVATAVGGNPAGLGILNNVMATTFGTPLPGTAPADWLTSLITALAFDVRGFADVLERTHGHPPFDNGSTAYVGSPDDPALNVVVARYEATPDATLYLERYRSPSGALGAPVLTVHNAHDPVAPVFHEGLLAAAAASAGASGALAQWPAATPYGHCAFEIPELLGAFGALVLWVEAGIPPAAP